jgi:hypothetical protein
MIDVLVQVAQWAGDSEKTGGSGNVLHLVGAREVGGDGGSAGGGRGGARLDSGLARGFRHGYMQPSMYVDAVVGSLRIEEQEVVRAWW